MINLEIGQSVNVVKKIRKNKCNKRKVKLNCAKSCELC